jgi:hypothetical protein
LGQIDTSKKGIPLRSIPLFCTPIFPFKTYGFEQKSGYKKRPSFEDLFFDAEREGLVPDPVMGFYDTSKKGIPLRFIPPFCTPIFPSKTYGFE